MKTSALGEVELAAPNGARFVCAYTETTGIYGTVQVDNNLRATHTQATADANHQFTIEQATLKVTVPSNNGTDYVLDGACLKVNAGFTGTISADVRFNAPPERTICFDYDHNGLRTRKTVTENGVTTTYGYTLHGKLITHLTKRTVDENGNAGTEELHFFYDAQSRPAFVKWSNAMYRYVHNLQGDIVGIVDATGNLVVEYKYDTWGEPLGVTGSLKTSLGRLNPFRYRGYVWDEETDLYYFRSRYYIASYFRFLNADNVVADPKAYVCNIYLYCSNRPVMCMDPSGKAIVSVTTNSNWIKEAYDKCASTIEGARSLIEAGCALVLGYLAYRKANPQGKDLLLPSFTLDYVKPTQINVTSYTRRKKTCGLGKRWPIQFATFWECLLEMHPA